jgi:ribA/ribD-fused uncharacterized protein
MQKDRSMIKLFDKEMNEIKSNIAEYQLNVFPLDNFAPFGLTMDNEYFQTSEHAFQYLKFVDTNKEVAESIKKSFSPNDARSIAHENKASRLANWSDIKYEKMEEVLKLKVEQNPIVKECLLNTKDYLIAECCIDEDTDWGVDNNNQGENHLGKTWMKIRDELRG